MEWENGSGNVEAERSRLSEPSIPTIENLTRLHLNIPEHISVSASLHATSELNKIYEISVDNGAQYYAFKVTLPFCPRLKTQSEVATMRLVRQLTTPVFVPKVFAHDDSSDNELGYEWILMEFVHGQSLYNRWRHLSMREKERVFGALADMQGRLMRSDNRFTGLGSAVSLGQGKSQPGLSLSQRAAKPVSCLNQAASQATLRLSQAASQPNAIRTQAVSQANFSLAPMASISWCHDLARPNSGFGPYRSTRDWFKARAKAAIEEQLRLLREAEAEGNKDYEESAKKDITLGERFLLLLNRYARGCDSFPTNTVLQHPDLDLDKIMIDDNGQLSGITGWDFSATMPQWRAVQLPRLWRGRDRYIRPDRDGYSDFDPDVDELDPGGKTDTYWDHLREYELTQLRKVYLDRLEEHIPGCTKISAMAAFAMDFDAALEELELDAFFGRVGDWLSAVEKGTVEATLGYKAFQCIYRKSHEDCAEFADGCGLHRADGGLKLGCFPARCHSMAQGSSDQS
ncbi:uncharacterized protein AB675_10095 [Cyphellophora attinorum]|uniref:Aminoglycoside phosphotransferase domain-containing protein n=1 Tax=Cyphellophora attinorum TaxID=1664694 RepID=A0A0N0NJ93_9EURO|nr:uncharacterized protein AB675_10095 [Phialophora attinorum]KPI36648.1 hypothetical protein AB675_10095 [Phialophora attinorum]